MRGEASGRVRVFVCERGPAWLMIDAAFGEHVGKEGSYELILK